MPHSGHPICSHGLLESSVFMASVIHGRHVVGVWVHFREICDVGNCVDDLVSAQTLQSFAILMMTRLYYADSIINKQ